MNVQMNKKMPKQYKARTNVCPHCRQALYCQNKGNLNENMQFLKGIQMQRQDFAGIFKMQKVNQSESFQEIEMRETQAVSPDSMVREEGVSEAIPAQSGWRCYWKQCTFLAMLILCSLMFGYEINTQRVERKTADGKITVDEYDFMVFCPATEEDLKPYQNTDLRRRLLTGSSYSLEIDESERANFLEGRTYLVRAQSWINGTGKNSNLVLEYCGRMRRFEQECKDSKDNCTANPMFDIPSRESIDIVWVNNLTQDTSFDAGNSCLSPSSDIHRCTLMAKSNSTRTFVDPTTHISGPTGDDNIKISYKSWPISTHVHGAEVRPVFDGNPLSWITNDKTLKKFGVGAFSLNDKCYFESFQQSTDQELKTNPPKFKLTVKGQPQYNFKVNRYPNKQNPGTLWYHDHSMRLTMFNVQHGLAGFYILRDENVQKYLDIPRSNEKFVLITTTNTSFNLNDLVSDTVYRFRFLNANYAGGMTFRYYFTYGECNKSRANMVPFTLIGADSSLFDHGIEDQREFVLSNAERIDLLIKFAADKTSFSICGDNQLNVQTAHTDKTHIDSGVKDSYKSNKINLGKPQPVVGPSMRTSINNIDLSPWVSYTDLSKIPDSQIAVKRMRPLIKLPTPLLFTIHGRADFHSGWSENPMIGSTEDWFLINTMPSNIPHPIHIHLVNYQIVKVYDLKLYNNVGNSYYEMDFVTEAIRITDQSKDEQVKIFKENIFTSGDSINYNYLNANLDGIKNNNAIRQSLSQIFPENKVDKNRVSGLDLLTKDNNGDYKYITGEGKPSPKVEYSRWKDTAFIQGQKAFQIRIRWTKSDYDEVKDKAKGNFFNVPSDQLREYPGYVYHCHILFHEDNEMMRPIMLQMPETALSASAPCNYQNWADKVKCINQHCKNPNN